ncbi:MAG: GAF domain-containing protein [Aggregatilineales bacterium]
MNSPTSELNSPDVAVLSELIRRQAVTSANLTGCKTFVDVAKVVAQHMLDEKQFVAVNMFLLDNDGKFAGYRTVASANREQVFEGIHELVLSNDDLNDSLRRIIASHDATMLDMASFVEANPAFAVWTEQYHLKSMLLMPLIRDDIVFGHIAINSMEQRPALSTVELDVYRGLASQISLIIYANRLLEDSQQAKSTASQLVQTNRQISTSSNHAEMLQAIMSFMPDNVRFIALVSFNTVLRDGETPRLVHMNAVVHADNTVEYPDIEDHFTPEEAQRLSKIIEDVRSGTPLANARLDILRDKYALTNHVDFFNSLNPDEVVTIGLRIGAHLHGLLVYGLETTNSQDALVMDNLLIIADQVAIVLENRRLLASAANTLNETQLLYHINRELLISESGLDVLRTLKHNLAQNAKSLSLVAVEWDVTNKDVSAVVLQDIIDKDGERSPEKVLVNRNTPEMIDKYKAEWALQGDDIDFIDDAVRIGETRPAVKNSIEAGIYASIVIPIREEDRLIQQIFIAFDAAQDFDAGARRLYQAIQDQVRLVVQNRRLLTRLERSLSETQNLYNSIQPLMQAQSDLEVLKAVKHTMASDADNITLLRVEWEDRAEPQITSMILEAYINTELGEGENHTDLLARMTEADRHEYETGWANITEDIEFIENFDVLVDTRPDLRSLHRRGVHSGILMPIFEDDTLRQMISIAFKEQKEFATTEKRLFRSLYTQLKIIMQNRRLVRDTQVGAALLGNQLRVMATLNQLASNLPIATTEEQLGEIVCEAILQALTVGSVSMWLNDDQPHLLRVVGEAPEMVGVGRKAPRNTNLQDAMVETERPIIVEDVEQDARISDTMRSFFAGLGVRAFALVPLMDTRVGYIGSIQLNLTEPQHYLDEASLETAQTMTNQAAVTLQNILLLRNTQRQALQLQQIANFAQLIQTTFDMREILEITLHNAHDLLKFDEFNILLYNTETGEMELVARQQDGVQFIHIQDAQPVNLEGTIGEQVWQTQQTVNIGNVQSLPDLRHNFDMDVQSIVAVPMYLRGTVQGVIEVGKLTSSAFSTTDIAIFQQLVNQLAVALESADAYTQNQRVARSKAQVNEISSSLQRQTDIDRIMAVTARELGKALGAKRARIRLGNPTHKDTTE